MVFPGATASRETATYAVLGAPLDVTTSFQPGTRFGPARIRTFAEPFEDYDVRTDQFFTDLDVHDAGDVRPWPAISDYLEHLGGTLSDFVAAGIVPLTLGGEHTVSIAGVRATAPDLYVCLDAHLDLRESFDDSRWSHACTTRRVLEDVEEVVILGARAGDKREWERAAADDVTVVAPDAVDSWEPPTADRNVYLSVDIDVADPGSAPGTGTMEPFGLAPVTIRRVIRSVAPMAIGFDVVEVNDRDDGQTAALAAKLLREFVFTHAAEA